MAALPSTLLSLEQLGETYGTAAAPTRRMLLIVNPYATTVSDRLKNLVAYALQGRYEVDAVETNHRGHAIELGREAALEGFDLVVAFGGDGTVNEAANGLAGSGVPLTCLPGGATNVYCRMLGIPNDVVDATEHLLRMADSFEPRRVDLAWANDRAFTFSAGLGLDASVVERVDRHPRLKARLRQRYYVYCAVTTFMRRYLRRPPQLVAHVEGHDDVRGVTAVIQNSDPYTYSGRLPIRLAEGGGFETGTLAGLMLARANPVDVPTIAMRAFSDRLSILNHRRVREIPAASSLVVETEDGRPVDLQVDGDHVGAVERVEFRVEPRALAVVS